MSRMALQEAKMSERDDRISELSAAIRSELDPVYHVTPGGLKWSKSTDALRELVALARAVEASSGTSEGFGAHD